MLQIALAVNYLHESWVMHCDLKVSNVLLNIVEDQKAYFSLSFEENREKDTKSSGVYSFAIIFFEVLNGKVPTNVLQSIRDRVRVGFTRCGLLSS